MARNDPAKGRWRDGILGGFLVFVLPVLVIVVAAGFWWANRGTDHPLERDPVCPPVETPPGSGFGGD